MTPIPFSKTNVLLKLDEHLRMLNVTAFECFNSFGIDTKNPVLDYITDELDKIKALKEEIEKMPIENNQHVTTEAMRNSLNDELIQLSDCLHNDINKLYAQAASTTLMMIKFNRENVEEF